MKILVTNKKNNINNFVIDHYEAGISLIGSEVKSLINSNASIEEAFVHINKNNEMFLINMYIKPYKLKNTFKKIDPARKRKLLMHKKEIIKIASETQKKKLGIFPQKIYINHGMIKVDVVVCKSKNKADKRYDIKKRELDREKRKFV